MLHLYLCEFRDSNVIPVTKVEARSKLKKRKNKSKNKTSPELGRFVTEFYKTFNEEQTLMLLKLCSKIENREEYIQPHHSESILPCY